MEEIKEQSTTSIEPTIEDSTVDRGDTELNDVDAIADAFDTTADGGSNEEQPVEETQPTEDVTTSSEQDFPSPEGFDATVWQTVPEQARAIIQQREEAHAKALSQERAKITESLVQTQQWAKNVNDQFTATMATLQQVTDAEFGSIDWNNLAQRDPAQYVQLQQQYINRINAVKQIQDNVAQLAKQYGEKVQAERQYALSVEANQVLPKIKAIMGSGYSEKEYVGQVVQYLKDSGVPENAINAMSHGYEAEIVTKAMLYDRMQKARLSAQQKISEAPTVSTPKGASSASDDASARLAKAKAYLGKHNNDTEALASVFEVL